jgi:hypothetical protein
MRFRFTIRDLLWLTVVVALAVGWWVSYRMRPYVFHTDGNGYCRMTEKATGLEWIKVGDKWFKSDDASLELD